MANIHEYLTWRGDVPFSVSPFNEVDALVLSELAYADFHGVVAEANQRITIEQARRLFWEKHTREEIMAQDSYTKTAPFLLDGMAGKARFGGTVMANYYDVIDTNVDIQLAALTFYLPDGTAFVAFRGTDDTVVGWKEDFNLSYMPETEGQRRALEVIEQACERCASRTQAYDRDVVIALRQGGSETKPPQSWRRSLPPTEVHPSCWSLPGSR